MTYSKNTHPITCVETVLGVPTNVTGHVIETVDTHSGDLLVFTAIDEMIECGTGQVVSTAALSVDEFRKLAKRLQTRITL